MAQRVISPVAFHNTVQKLRQFFLNKGFIECHPQSAVSILAACEDPKNISQYNFNDTVWPLPQTGQMWLEHCLLQNPEVEGLFCVSTSYRNEPNPIPGRHERIFPLFEFEMKGDIKDLATMEKELCMHMGFGKFYDNKIENIPEGEYREIAKKYKVKEIEAEQENQMVKDFGPVFLLKDFPLYTSPFWNMKMRPGTDIAEKIDVILGGQETIGSAERSCNKEEMRELFLNISEGEYKTILFNKFGEKRVMKELDQFLSYDFFPRVGGGIGVTRMISALQSCNLLENSQDISLFKDVCEKVTQQKQEQQQIKFEL
ncbi:hypothetical protein PPERSA_08514 [Pseudocohnilembus persalinus]|uniref:Aminoacyl-tRNA synthetase class II (D/K/N) domain-containing protein n=1 Tax=Pseudocohnilembus persalinus TaxID=266149 RepID=A0A0V0R6I1_PSEPJ|nr:hypothetical protein PPERSA_08514 [Pseudocohnilembus persalinus]|eukprot:KRX10111.1 hypothetical protein PPERSA_08514 [Pseudocohnilembus persalinus]